MDQVTPPGWYPDPGQTNEGPRTERWWDGSAWTEQIRTPAAPGWGAPGYPAFPPPPGGRRARRRAVAAVVAVVVLAGTGVGAYALSTDDGGGDRTVGARVPSGGPSSPDDGRGDGGGGDGSGGGGLPGGPGEPGGPGQGPGGGQDIPGLEKGYATDLASGISIRVPKGWKGQSGAAASAVTTGDYSCPGDDSQTCVRGGVFSSPAEVLKLKSAQPEAAAREDISKNAEESYGGEIYGKITKHDELASESVQVAGEKGYLVRWKVTTGKGDDGYVESLAFPSPASEKVLVVVRFGFDVNADAPKVSQMDSITKGIKKAAVGAGGSGKGV